eukprot:3357034-Prorocentrum_lima.AAC.1
MMMPLPRMMVCNKGPRVAHSPPDIWILVEKSLGERVDGQSPSRLQRYKHVAMSLPPSCCGNA